MSGWGDSELLVHLLDRQFAFLFELHGTAQILRVPRVLAFLLGEPQIAGVLDDLRVEAGVALAEYDAADEEIRAELASLWVAHGEDFRRRLHGRDDELHQYWSMDRFAEGLAQQTAAGFSDLNEGATERTKKLLLAFEHWWKCCVQPAEAADEPVPDDLRNLGGPLSRLKARLVYWTRRLHQQARSLPWPAYERLGQALSLANPPLPDAEDSLGWAMLPLANEAADHLRQTDAVLRGKPRTGMHKVDAVYDSLDADAKIVHEELRLRIGLSRSRLALVQRYAARAEAFDAERLRLACEADSRNAERLLTLDLGRYLFDAGLPPLIDATVGGLRPDILHVEAAALFYVEAKQYADEHPASQLRKAYAQVWGTWGRLRKTFPSQEAFLVVFRRAGPWVELPPVIHHHGLKLYSVVADISTQAGSREKLPVITLTEPELRPQEDGQ